MGGVTAMTPYIDPFSGHVIQVTPPADDEEGAPGPNGPGEPEPVREYSEEEDRVNRCIAGLRRRR